VRLGLEHGKPRSKRGDASDPEDGAHNQSSIPYIDAADLESHGAADYREKCRELRRQRSPEACFHVSNVGCIERPH